MTFDMVVVLGLVGFGLVAFASPLCVPDRSVALSDLCLAMRVLALSILFQFINKP